jgi:hypothetical protein
MSAVGGSGRGNGRDEEGEMTREKPYLKKTNENDGSSDVPRFVIFEFSQNSVR